MVDNKNMIDKDTMEYKLFKMLDDLVYNISERYCEGTACPVDGELFNDANDLLDEYAIEQMKKMDEEELAV